MPLSLAESPMGLIHMIQMLNGGRAVTICGREVDWDKWSRISMLDEKMFGKSSSTIRAMIEVPSCDRCFRV